MQSLTQVLATGALGIILALPGAAAPIRTLPGLTGIQFYELTNGPQLVQFAPNNAAITARINAGLSPAVNDYVSSAGEYYDFFYSNADGTFNLDGEFLTIEADYYGASSGLNISEVFLQFSGASPFAFPYATNVASFALGDVRGNAGSIANIGDNNINTGTALGSFLEGGRMRLTVGFEPAPVGEVPEPATMAGVGLGLCALAALRRRQRIR
jgi:hypothetical protein